MAKTDALKQKRHCMIVHAYYPIGETRVEREALALIDAGYAVDVVCLKHKRDKGYETIDGVDIYRLPVRRNKKGGLTSQLFEYLRFFILVFFRLVALYPRKRYQTVQAHNVPDFLVFSALLPKIFGARVILDIHDLMPEFFAYKKKLGMNSAFTRLVILQEQLSCRFADHVITVTDTWRDRLIERGVAKEKVSVVMNVADERYFFSNDRVKEEQADRNSFHLIYHGTFKEYYGMKELIQAMDMIRDQIPGIHLTLQGVGEYADEMIHLVDELDLKNEVTVNDFAIPVSELPALINTADIGVIPNRNDLFTGDLLPTKMLEYIALGKPVIAARTRVISYYFNEDMVLFFDPGDAHSLSEQIVHSYKHWEDVLEKKKNYDKFTSVYNWKLLSQAYVELVSSL